MPDAEAVIARSDARAERLHTLLRPVAEWFHAREGKMFTRQEAARRVAGALGVPHTQRDINRTIGDLVGDGVDPVVQVQTDDGKYVGVVEYDEGPFWYTYTAYHTGAGAVRKGVCAACVAEAEREQDVYAPQWTHDAYDEETLRGLMTAHHAARHAGYTPTAVLDTYAPGATVGDDVSPADIAPHMDHAAYIDDHDFGDVLTGATLVSTTTTTSGDTFWHAGNDGSGSGLDADLIRGFNPSGGTTDEFLRSDGAGGVEFATVNVDETVLAYDFVVGV